MKILFLVIPFFIFACANQQKTETKKVVVSYQDEESIRRALRPYLPVFRDCYLKVYEANKELVGEMTFAWEVHSDGQAKNIATKPTATSLKNSELELCIADAISRARFPAPEPASVLVVQDFFMRFEGNDEKVFIETTINPK